MAAAVDSESSRVRNHLGLIHSGGRRIHQPEVKNSENIASNATAVAEL